MGRIIFIFFLLVTQGLYAQRSEIFQRNGLAIGGYDPVSFFTQGKAVKGEDSLFFVWKEAKWLFTSRKNLDTFSQNPGNYAPAYGGYCAYGMSDGHKAPTEPDTWTIIENRLYFNYNRKVKEIWLKDTPGHIEKADANWPLLMHKE